MFVVDEAGGIIFVLNPPAAPEIVDALLVAATADDTHSMKVNSLFDGIGRVCICRRLAQLTNRLAIAYQHTLSVYEYAEPLK